MAVGASTNCDAGMALSQILDLMVQADMDDHLLQEPEDDDAYAQRSEAETALFVIACRHAAKNRGEK